MSPDWTPLRAALSACRTAGLALPLWWRDDDAIADTPALDRLDALACDLRLPVHLAVIPQGATPVLADRLGSSRSFVPVVHGWQHHNHAPPGMKKSEFGTPRDEAQAELTAALDRMQGLFPGRLLRLFVPPWNRIDQGLMAPLAAAGYRGLSTFGPRTAAWAAPGLLQINTHIDPIDWRGGRDLADPDRLVAQATDLLHRRLRGTADPTEPLGYLSHHLVHSERVWEFSRQFLTELLEGGAIAQPIAPLLETRNEPT